MAIASPNGVVGKRYLASGRCRITKHQGRARGRIDLHPVMHFNDLDIEVVPERGRNLFGQGDEQVDAEAHVARP